MARGICGAKRSATAIRFQLLITPIATVEKRRFALAELSQERRVIGVRGAFDEVPRQGLGPGEGRHFPIAEDARLAPDGDEIELGAGQAKLAGDVEVELKAEGAAVDLRGAQFDELCQLFFEAGNR